MTILQAMILGVIQGLTEFLPVSSSGHLVLAQSLLGLSDVPVAFDVALHLGTALAVVIFYAHDIGSLIAGFFVGLSRLVQHRPWNSVWAEPSFREATLLLIATIPTGLMGVLLSGVVDQLFASMLSVGVGWLITGVVLWLVDRLGHGGTSRMGVSQALIVGVAQGVAIAPGVSRSGLTIAGALVAGLSREAAARFSFLVALPAIIGAAVLEIPSSSGHIFLVPTLVGAALSTLSGYVAVGWLLRVLQRGSLKPFAIYVVILGLLVMGWQLM